MNDVLMQAKRLKESAKANRDFDEMEEALNDLNKAISYLIPIDAQVEDGDYKTALRRELADCYGMMGGIYRRLANKGDLKRNLEESFHGGTAWQRCRQWSRRNWFTIAWSRAWR